MNIYFETKYPILTLIVKKSIPYSFFDLSMEDLRESIISSLEQFNLPLEKLREDLLSALEDPNFNWMQFALDTELAYPGMLNCDKEVINYLKYIIWEIFYPESRLDITKEGEVVVFTLVILSEKDDWVLAEDLLSELKKRYPNFISWQYHHLFVLRIHLAGTGGEFFEQHIDKENCEWFLRITTYGEECANLYKGGKKVVSTRPPYFRLIDPE